MKKVLLGGLALAALILLAAAGYLAWLVRSLDTPQFRAALLERVSRTAGTNVRVERMDVSLLSGVKLRGIAVANPGPFPGDLLTAQAFVLRYRLRPLLAGRLEIDEVRLEKPVLALAMDARGTFNYERLGGRDAAASPATAAPAALPLRIVLSRLALEDATITMTDPARQRLFGVEGARLKSAFEIEDGVATGTGNAAAHALTLGQSLFLRDLESPLKLTKQALALAPVRAKLGGGEVTGEIGVRFLPGFRYTARVEVAKARVKTLLAEAGARQTVDGTLRARARFEGSGGLATLVGRGEGSISGCRVSDSRSLALLAAVLGLPELARPELDECRAEFTQQGYRVTTPALSLKGAQLELGGRGTLRLDTGALDYDLALALPPRVFARVTRQELRSAFRTREDGWATIEFRLTGTTLEPRTDLLARVGRGAVEGAVRKGLGRLFGRKEP
jgi:uncharacterized protein involved in outer membrane biogenesis